MKRLLFLLIAIVLTACEYDYQAPTPEDILVGTWKIYDPVPTYPTVVEYCYDSIFKITQTINGIDIQRVGTWSMYYTVITIKLPNEQYDIHLEMLGTYEMWFHDKNGVLNKTKRTSKYRYPH